MEKPNESKIILSISCITYNHASFIRECLDSFLMQKTSFPFEVLIHDDASNDGTTEIIKEYENKYHGIIKPIYQKENQYSKGLRGMMVRFNFPRAKGKYIALCEGDDYWTDPLKLQKQVDFLEANPEYSSCFHCVKVLSNNIFTDGGHLDRPETTTIDDLIRGNYIYTASYVFRNNFTNKDIPDLLFKSKIGDYSLFMINAQFGKIKRINEFMSVYRMHPDSCYSSLPIHERYLILLDWFNQIINYFSEDTILQKKLIERRLEILRIFGELLFDSILFLDKGNGYIVSDSISIKNIPISQLQEQITLTFDNLLTNIQVKGFRWNPIKKPSIIIIHEISYIDISGKTHLLPISEITSNGEIINQKKNEIDFNTTEPHIFFYINSQIKTIIIKADIAVKTIQELPIREQELKSRILNLEHKNKTQESQISKLSSELQLIHKSIGWKLLLLLYMFKKNICNIFYTFLNIITIFKKHIFHSNTLEKNIFIFWYDGFDKLPPIVKLCIDNWKELNPNYNFIFLGKKEADELLNEFPFSAKEISIQALSDIIRIFYLKKFGGIWVDATVLPIVPLEKWLPKVISKGFFAFHCYHAKGCLLSSWFLAAKKQHYIMEQWWLEIKRYWSIPRTLVKDPREGDCSIYDPVSEISPGVCDSKSTFPYYWVHYLFTRMVTVNYKIKKYWDKVPDISSTPLHELQGIIRNEKSYDASKIVALFKSSFLQKLDWRLDCGYIKDINDLIYQYNKSNDKT